MEPEIVADGVVVTMDYTLRLKDGTLIETSEGQEPLEYLHGQGQIIPGLEAGVAGMRVGETRQVIVPAAQAYGERQPDQIHTLSREQFPPNEPLLPGMMFYGRDSFGNSFPVTVIEVNPDTVVVDLNHPLAGEDLYFDVTVRGLRQATAEELMHGHVHGQNGDEGEDEEEEE